MLTCRAPTPVRVRPRLAAAQGTYLHGWHKYLPTAAPVHPSTCAEPAGGVAAVLDAPLVVAEVGGDDVLVLQDGLGDLAGEADADDDDDEEGFSKEDDNEDELDSLDGGDDSEEEEKLA